MRVWIVGTGEYSGQSIAGVFSTRALADRYIEASGNEAWLHDAYTEGSDGGWDTDDLDAIVTELAGRFCWMVGVNAYGATKGHLHARKCLPTPERVMDYGAIVWAADEGQALLFARVRLAQAEHKR